jgi:hypothetical protein
VFFLSKRRLAERRKPLAARNTCNTKELHRPSYPLPSSLTAVVVRRRDPRAVAHGTNCGGGVGDATQPGCPGLLSQLAASEPPTRRPVQ